MPVIPWKAAHHNQVMKVLDINHVQLAMPRGEEEQAHKFYADLLGFTEVSKPPELGNRGGMWFESGNVQLHLCVEADFHPARKAHPAFLVDDLELFIRRFQESDQEVDISQPPLAGYKRAHVHDPFGNRIELMEKIG